MSDTTPTLTVDQDVRVALSNYSILRKMSKASVTKYLSGEKDAEPLTQFLQKFKNDLLADIKSQSVELDAAKKEVASLKDSHNKLLAQNDENQRHISKVHAVISAIKTRTTGSIFGMRKAINNLIDLNQQ